MMKTDTYDVQHSDLTITQLEDGEARTLGEDEEPRASAPNAPQARAFQRLTEPLSFDGEAITLEQNAKKPSGKRRVIMIAALVAALGIGGYYGHHWWTEGRFLVSTDDAYVKANLSVISAKVPGIIMFVPIRENMEVHTGDVLAQIDDRDYTIAVDSARNKVGNSGSNNRAHQAAGDRPASHH